MEQQEIRNQKGELIEYQWYIKEQSKKENVIILVHGLHLNKDSEIYVDLANKFEKCNIFLFTFACNDTCSYLQQVEEVQQVYSFLISQGYNVKGVVGHSKGACVVLAWSALYGGNVKIVMLVGRYQIENTGNKPRSYEELIGKDLDYLLDKTIQKLGKPPVKPDQGRFMHLYAQNCKTSVLIIHGKIDNIVPFSESQLLQENLTNANVKAAPFEDLEHFLNPHREKVCRLIEDFVLNEENLSKL